MGVARAWCGRVGGALARARAAHPPLLRRLLAPAPALLLAAKDDRLEGRIEVSYSSFNVKVVVRLGLRTH